MTRAADTRGVSEAISFVLVFALIVATVGTVYAFGFGGLQDVRDAEQVNNAERAMDVFAANIEDIVVRGAPSRGTELQLSGATLASNQPTYINVSGSSATDNFSTGNTTFEPVTYTQGDTHLRYAAGAVVRVQPEGSLMVHEPPMTLDAQHVVVPFVQFDVPDKEVGGSQTVLVRTERELREELVESTTTYDTVTMNVTSPGADAWERYLESRGMTCTRTDPNRVSCTLSDVERVHVVWHLLGVTFD